MALTVKHAHQTVIADDGSDVGANAWNAAHTITGFGSETRLSKAANYSVLTSDTGTQFDNGGAAGAVTLTLPTVTLSDIGIKFGFCDIVAQTLTVAAPASTRIALGINNSSVAGNVSSAAVFSYIELEAVSTTQYVAKSITGTWEVI